MKKIPNPIAIGSKLASPFFVFNHSVDEIPIRIFQKLGLFLLYKQPVHLANHLRIRNVQFGIFNLEFNY
jgi:hypothetical protein